MELDENGWRVLLVLEPVAVASYGAVGRTRGLESVAGSRVVEPRDTGWMVLMVALELDTACFQEWLLLRKAVCSLLDESDVDALSRWFCGRNYRTLVSGIRTQPSFALIAPNLPSFASRFMADIWPLSCMYPSMTS